MKKVIILSILSLGIVFLTGCGQQVNKNQSTTPTSVVQQPSQPVISQNQDNQKVVDENQNTNQQPAKAVVSKSKTTQQPIQPVDETADWKTYQNKELGFELKIPSYVSVDKVFNDQYNRLVIFKSEKENFEVRLREGETISLDQYYYLDFPVSSWSTLGGKEALVFEAPNGYCDGPGCSDPFVAYSAKNGDDFYNLIFNGDIKLSDTEKSILSFFKFTQ